jgi:DNA-3-methyladenine glycosylase
VVARELLGQVVALRRPQGWVGGTIIETEAYLGAGDEASHSHRGPTPRSAVMFGRPGLAYVYLIYGMHHCLNVVTEPVGVGAAVLLRALAPWIHVGLPVLPLAAPGPRLAGPGLLCREMGVSLAMNGWDLATSDLRICAGVPVPEERVRVGPRVGINRARELDLRFRVGP